MDDLELDVLILELQWAVDSQRWEDARVITNKIQSIISENHYGH